MALKPCKECGKAVSTQALACPHCGAQWPAGRAIGFVTWAAIIFLGVIVADYVAHSLSPKAPQTSAAAAIANAGGDRAAARAKILKSMLPNPTSFELIQALAMPHEVTCFQYRSQSADGAMNVARALADGVGVVTEQTRDFTRLWSLQCAKVPAVDVTAYTKSRL
jgi:hypothetical protein